MRKLAVAALLAFIAGYWTMAALATVIVETFFFPVWGP